MTYPPQPPGPPQGPYGPPPPGPQDPFNQGPYNQGPNPYQPQPPWAGGPPGYPMGPPPKKPRTGLIATLIIVAILVVGGGGVAAYLLLGRDDEAGKGSGQGGGEGGGARAAAQTYVLELEKALNAPVQEVDLGKLKPVTCGEDFAKMEDDLADAKGRGESTSAGPGDEGKIRIRLKDFERTPDGAKFTLTEREAGGGGDEQTRDMTVAKEGAGWQVCGLYEKGQSGGGETGDNGGSSGSSPTRAVPPNPIPPPTT
jgi:hypothetical protein